MIYQIIRRKSDGRVMDCRETKKHKDHSYVLWKQVIPNSGGEAGDYVVSVEGAPVEVYQDPAIAQELVEEALIRDKVAEMSWDAARAELVKDGVL